jgi:DNA-directed RNA polymerase specialized sigma24 family protein
VREDTLDKLLGLLGPDKQSAALEYRKLHRRLSRFFEWNNVEDPEALADEAIDRLGKRVLEEDIGEKVRNAARNWEMHMPDTSREDTAMDEALQHCLAKLQADRRKLVKRYYTFNSGEKVKLHQRLAHELGITINALRNRALRARQDLEDCMRKFLQENAE